MGQDPLPGLSALCCQPQSGYRGAEPCALIAQGLQDSPQIFTSQHPSSAPPGRSLAIWSQFISFTLKTWPVSLSLRGPTQRDMTSHPGWPITTIIRNPSESCLSESWALSQGLEGDAGWLGQGQRLGVRSWGCACPALSVNSWAPRQPLSSSCLHQTDDGEGELPCQPSGTWSGRRSY